MIYGKCIAMFGGPRASMRKARDPGYYRAAAACHDTMKLLRRLVAMLTASGAARAADPLPAGVHESQMAVCGAAPQTFWFQQFGGGGDGQIVLANDGLDGQVPGEPTMCIDVSCGQGHAVDNHVLTHRPGRTTPDARPTLRCPPRHCRRSGRHAGSTHAGPTP